MSESKEEEAITPIESEKKSDRVIHMEDQANEYNKYASGEKSKLAKQLNQNHVAVERDETQSSSNLTSSNHDIPYRSLSSDTKVLHSLPPSYCGNNGTMMSLDGSQSDKGINNVAACEASNNDYCQLYIKDLGYETRRQLGLRLDLEIAGVANWKSVADAIGFSFLEIQNFQQERLKTENLLFQTQVRFRDITLGHLIEILHELDREDVITDLQPCFKRDLERAISPRRSFPPRGSSSMSTMPLTEYPSASIITQPSDTEKRPFPVQDDEISTSGSNNPSMEKQFMQSTSYMSTSYQPTSFGTFMDPEPEVSKVPDKHYDAFVLYDIADKEFILNEFLPKIEGEAKISLCIPHRDLDAGERNYHAQLEAMIKRCPKLVVILSDEFLTSPDSQWGLNVGVAIDPAARRRKIIPVIYKRITKMNILAGINACDRTRVLEDSWFWNGIVRSLRKPVA